MTMPTRVLLVEDHSDIQHLLRCHLEQTGLVVHAVSSGHDALRAAEAEAFDLVILDIGLPDLDGIEVLRRLRAQPASDLPILLLTARHAVEDRVAGLDAGADDYLSKPCNLQELDARLRSIIRRTGRRRAATLEYADLRVDRMTRELYVGDKLLELTRREFTLLEELIRAGGHTLVREALEDRLYGTGDPVSANALEAVVSRLRRRLVAAGAHAAIDTIRGIGYRLVVPARQASE
jgi:two-component system, OmpR family, response regulator QseB